MENGRPPLASAGRRRDEQVPDGSTAVQRAVWLDELREGIVLLSGSAWGFVSIGVGSYPQVIVFRLDERDDNQLPFWEEDDDPGPPPSRRILVEANASEHLLAEDALSPEQEAALARLQWLPPHSDCAPELCDVEHLDWFCFVTLQEGASPSPAVMGLLLATLGIYGVEEGTHCTVSYHCSSGKKLLPEALRLSEDPV